MKIFLVLVVMLASSIAKAEVRPEYSGAWYWPTQAGHGFSLEVISNQRSIGWWYTYDTEGNPIWLLLDGVNVDNRIEALAYYFEGMRFGSFAEHHNERIEWGNVTFTFEGCMYASVEWSPTMPGFEQGALPLMRLTWIAGMECQDLVGELAGQWAVFVGTSRQDNSVEIQADGSFFFSDAMACSYQGRIESIDRTAGTAQARWVNWCYHDLPVFTASGVITHGGSQMVFQGDPVMVSLPDVGDPFLVTPQLTFTR